jgi:hypothetical protein
MKKVIVVSLLFLLCIAGSLFLSGKKVSIELADLSLRNIEALAGNETSLTMCFGIGDIDCTGDKVEWKITGL